MFGFSVINTRMDDTLSNTWVDGSWKQRAEQLEQALRDLKNCECWCEVGLGNPNYQGHHTEACKRAQQLIAYNEADETTLKTRVLDKYAGFIEQNNEYQRSFDLRWKADTRAIERWRASNPAKAKQITFPDHADLCVFLLEELDRLQQINTMLSETTNK